MAAHRHGLPQLDGTFFLTDAGIETDLIFNHGLEIREFAAHTLLPDPAGREAVANYLRGFLALARDMDAGFILDSQTWKAHMHWARDLGATEAELQRANMDAVDFIAGLRDAFAENRHPIVLNGVMGPRGDAYAPEAAVAADAAQAYHAQQIAWLAATEVDMVTALTFTQAAEAIGLVRAAQAADLPAVVSFTVETDGRLPDGQPLGEAIEAVDEATDAAAAYFMINCAHPDHFSHALGDHDWARRIRGLRCNASRLSHAELDECEVLDDGDPRELGSQYAGLMRRMPWLNVLGGCCGSDLRHVREIARAVRA
ncbi:MAG: homocysteine S-methyltransferase [Xanthomonadales bacterium]|nr:homocysteine S-methyltransferase [Xanthomonadales bacterium]NIN58779.1 homocysteine S-methyltransferase [Xanthomonadales bacterium]NIN74047.1 homocysteine S-methyltransferase [Xanthomonadales bacterium]NIO13797.1 homocysteine S-methyltransferase [Xanthomonadales bacterium]NIP11172.1 homocysteine S-methyltransferase [Xanthomonadales bacterium]